MVVPGLANDKEVGDEFGVYVDGVLVEEVLDEEGGCGAELGAHETLEARFVDGELGVCLLQVVDHVIQTGERVAPTTKTTLDRTQEINRTHALPLASTLLQLLVAYDDVVIFEAAAFEELEEHAFVMDRNVLQREHLRHARLQLHFRFA